MGECWRRKRVLLGLSILAVVAGAGFAKNPTQSKATVPFNVRLSKPDTLRHALNRLTFGTRPGDVESIIRIGLKRWIDIQLHPENVPENRVLLQRLQPFESLRLSIREAYVRYPPRHLVVAAVRSRGEMADILSPQQIALRPQERQQLFAFAPVPLRREMMASVSPQKVIAMDLTECKVLRAVYSNRQLQELMVDFWFNHFNVFLNKGAERYTVRTYERDAIRPHIFGKFHDLLLETAKSPAMLFYLDNWQSVAPENANVASRPKARAKRGLNENYGRELLELHTLGVEGGYTQRDVVDVARCFTGWTIANPRNGGAFEYEDRVHDKGQKVVLGHLIPAGGGMSDGLTVIDILSRHPSTARFISFKLAQRFVSDDPPSSLVAHMTKTFLKTKGDMREVVRAMIMSPEFFSQGAYNAKIKSPFEMIVSALRATNADVVSGYALADEFKKLGEPLYRKSEPTGYGDANSEWVTSAGLLERMNFCLALAHNRVPGVRVDVSSWAKEAAEDPLRLSRSILQKTPDPQTSSAIEKMMSDEKIRAQLASAAKLSQPQIPSLIAGITLGSPEFQRR
ncbi:MAG: DUF1800 domain-containing protein [Bryobacteraceae bacterium]